MRSGKCAKCSSTDVRIGAQVANKGGVYGSNSIPITFWSAAALDNYVCVACGYVESYVADASKLRRIAEKWPRSAPE